MQERASHAERVLSFWHKVEFFESTPLKDVENGHGAIHYHLEELRANAETLPWLDRQHVRRAGADYCPENAYTYTLYLGVFKRSEVFDIAQKAFPEYTASCTEQQRDDGLTCSLTLKVNANGCVAPDSIAISTAPWVLGMLQQGHLNDVTMEGFSTSAARLQARLDEIFTVADNLKQTHDVSPMLSTFELAEVLKAIEILTPFQPQDGSTPAVVIALHKTNISFDTNTAALPGNQQALASLESLLTESTPAPQHDTSEEDEQEITILNSFFIQDIETVIQHCRKQGFAPGSPLACYLSGQRAPQPDLLLPEGRELLIKMLEIAKIPKGRWPGDDEHSMSLMQQFAINCINEQLHDTGLYSVNGPPGTGKTTMLRDLVANNIVKRAEVLATLPSSHAAFAGELTAVINDDTKTIKTLLPALTGFEMVVASSNNAAVENITKELPQAKTLGEHYSSAGYLTAVAQKLAAHHDEQNDKTYVSPVEESCWGLIAAALGNSKNRSRLGERIFFKPIDRCDANSTAERSIIQHYRTLIPALKQLADGRDTEQDFRFAQHEFSAALEAVERAFKDIEQLQQLSKYKEKVDLFEAQHTAAQRTHARAEARYARYKARRVGLWPLTAYLKHRKLLQRTKASVERSSATLRMKALQLAQHQKAYDAADSVCRPLYQRYNNIVLPTPSLDLEQPEIQRITFGHCIELNRVRAQLTLKAFALHQAWLVAVYADSRNQLWHTLNALMPMLQGGVAHYDAAKALWQMLFMIIPVISSTFASFANQFNALKENDLGWLFIDEAGQATPQQAVGALWRAKRAVVVGDPLQVEPVFTVPTCLVSAMAEHTFGKEAFKWSPATTSVQTIADTANAFGTYQIASPQWVGSPLRVHRRCLEPMFSIANTIAYNGKMIHGQSHLPNDIGNSSWKNISGEVEGHHFVPRQAEFILRRLEEHYQKHQCLPALYIISPFKDVAMGIRKMLREGLPAEMFGGRSKQQAWLKQRIGTVHTFQGKEEDTVILVLGLSNEAPGAANWAASKPNLLNVALTRAKKSIYVIGDPDIWANKAYFSEAWHQLGRH